MGGFPKKRIEIDTNFSTIIGDEFLEMNVFGHEDSRIRRTYDYKMEGKTLNTSIAEATEKGWNWRCSLSH